LRYICQKGIGIIIRNGDNYSSRRRRRKRKRYQNSKDEVVTVLALAERVKVISINM